MKYFTSCSFACLIVCFHRFRSLREVKKFLLAENHYLLKYLTKKKEFISGKNSLRKQLWQLDSGTLTDREN